MITRLALLTAVGVAAWASRPTRPTEPPLPRAPNAIVTTLTAPGYFTEPSVAVDPANPQHIVVAYQVNASAAYSRDGGWT